MTRVLATKAMPISNIDDPRKVPHYVTGLAKISQILILDGAQILTHVIGHAIITDAFTKPQLQLEVYR